MTNPLLPKVQFTACMALLFIMLAPVLFSPVQAQSGGRPAPRSMPNYGSRPAGDASSPSPLHSESYSRGDRPFRRLPTDRDTNRDTLRTITLSLAALWALLKLGQFIWRTFKHSKEDPGPEAASSASTRLFLGIGLLVLLLGLWLFVGQSLVGESPWEKDQRLRYTRATELVEAAKNKQRIGDCDGAIADCTGALEQFKVLFSKDFDLSSDPTWASLRHDAYLCRGVAKEDKQLVSAAIEDYSEAIALDPKQSPAYYFRGNLRRRMLDKRYDARRRDEAVADIVRGLESESGPDGWRIAPRLFAEVEAALSGIKGLNEGITKAATETSGDADGAGAEGGNARHAAKNPANDGKDSDDAGAKAPQEPWYPMLERMRVERDRDLAKAGYEPASAADEARATTRHVRHILKQLMTDGGVLNPQMKAAIQEMMDDKAVAERALKDLCLIVRIARKGGIWLSDRCLELIELRAKDVILAATGKLAVPAADYTNQMHRGRLALLAQLDAFSGNDGKREDIKSLLIKIPKANMTLMTMYKQRDDSRDYSSVISVLSHDRDNHFDAQIGLNYWLLKEAARMALLQKLIEGDLPEFKQLKTFSATLSEDQRSKFLEDLVVGDGFSSAASAIRMAASKSSGSTN